jgi:DNA-binding transcriptional LysR family regulator
LLKAYKSKYDQVDVQISYRRSSEVYEDVLNDEADLGIVAYPRARRGVIVETFSKDKLVVICPPSHPLAVLKSIRVTDLKGLNFIAFEPDLPTRKAVDQILTDRNVNVRTILELDNVETVKRAVEVDTGISLVPYNSVVEEVRSGQLKALELKDADMVRPMGMVVKRGCTLTPALREFISVLRACSELDLSLEEVGRISEDAALAESK